MIGINSKGRVVQQPQLFLRAGTYKREEMGGSGYHTEKGRSARPVGGWWLDFEMARSKSSTVVHVNYRSAK